MILVMEKAPSTASEVSDPRSLGDVRSYLADLLAAGQHEALLEHVMRLLADVLADNTDKSHRNAALLKQLYGRKSERMSAEQLDLFLQELANQDETSPPPEPMPPAEPKPERPPQRRPGRNPLPAHLPRIKHELTVAPEDRPCPQCGKERTCIGHESSEVLDFVPGHFEVHVYEREKLACKPCQEGVVIAPAAEKLVPGGMCGPGLMTQILCSKYQDHTPLYRLSQIFKRSGVDVAESTLGSWVEAGATLLLRLVQLIWDRAAASPLIGADDTGIQVLDADHDKGIKRGHLWMYLGYDDDGKPRWPAFRYTADWSKKGPAKFLLGFSGILQGDGYKGWFSLEHNELKGIIRAGCLAHVRRKFVEALEAKTLSAAVAVKIIQKLYLVEAKARVQELDAKARLALRQAESVPLMAELQVWLNQQRHRARPKSPLGKAVTYLDNQWSTLQVFLADGRVPIDNNEVENKIRPVAIGRKNYLFCGSDAGAERAAIVYTILATCKLAGVEAWAYLRDVLPKLARRLVGADLEDLLPHRWLNRGLTVDVT